MQKMSLPQRLVLVAALGAATTVAWLWWHSGTATPNGAWSVYPGSVQQTDTYFVVRPRQIKDLLVPLGLIAFWTGVSLWLLAPQSAPVVQ